MAEFVRIKIGENVYTCNKLNPMDALEFGMRALAVLSPAVSGIIEAHKEGGDPLKVFNDISKALKDKDATPLLKEAIAQCFTPQNQDLGDVVEFNRWFSEHPGEMFHLGALALYHLVKDFFPSQLATIASDYQIKLQNQSQTEVQ